jgi:hypothetical protein
MLSPVRLNHYKIFYGISNNDLSNKRDKPTTGVIQLSASECLPTALGQEVSYQNNLLVNALKVSVFIAGRAVTLDTLNGLMDAQYGYWENTIPNNDSSITCVEGGNYWRGKVLMTFVRSRGTITINVQAKGNSIALANLKVSYIYYEK